jgi:hypothetical protein
VVSPHVARIFSHYATRIVSRKTETFSYWMVS